MKLHNTMTPDEQDALNAHLGERARRSVQRIVRRRWTVTFETGSVTFTTALDIDEAFAIKWARKAEGVPQSEKVTRVTCEPPNAEATGSSPVR